MASTIIGATTLEQLQENLSCTSVALNEDILTEIEAIHDRYPTPAP
jgi:aryl-alcohol dehydrogenase (NADP+)